MLRYSVRAGDSHVEKEDRDVPEKRNGVTAVEGLDMGGARRERIMSHTEKWLKLSFINC